MLFRLGDAMAAQNGRRVSARQTPADVVSSSFGTSADTITSSFNPTRSRSGRMTETELEESVSCIIEKMQKGVQVREGCVN